MIDVTLACEDDNSNLLRLLLLLMLMIRNGRGLPNFRKKEHLCGVTKNVSPKIFEIDPHHADTNLQADVFNGGGVPPSSAFLGDFMILEVLG